MRDERQLRLLEKQLRPDLKYLPEKIALPYQNGVAFTEVANIIYCEARDNYTLFQFKDGSHHIAAKTLKSIQEILEERNFLRVHRQYILCVI